MVLHACVCNEKKFLNFECSLLDPLVNAISPFSEVCCNLGFARQTICTNCFAAAHIPTLRNVPPGAWQVMSASQWRLVACID